MTTIRRLTFQAGTPEPVYAVSFRDRSLITYPNEATQRFARGTDLWLNDVVSPKIERGFAHVLGALKLFDVTDSGKDVNFSRDVSQKITTTEEAFKLILEKTCVIATFAGCNGTDNDKIEINRKLAQVDNSIINPFSSFLSERAVDIRNAILADDSSFVPKIIEDITLNKFNGAKVVMERLGLASNELVRPVLLRLGA